MGNDGNPSRNPRNSRHHNPLGLFSRLDLEMPIWSEDLSACSLEQVLQSQAENRAWHKQIRLQTAEIIERRLAKQITRDEYVEHRKVTGVDAAECQRRASILLDVLARKQRV